MECGSIPNIWNSEEGVYNGTYSDAFWLLEAVLSRNGCFWLCLWSGPFTTRQRRTPPPYSVSLTKIYYYRDQLWDSWQGAFSHCRFVLRMVSFFWRSSTSSHGPHQSQDPWILHVCQGIESTTSSLEYITFALQLCHHILSRFQANSVRCSFPMSVSCTKGKRCSLRPTKDYPYQARATSAEDRTHHNFDGCIFSPRYPSKFKLWSFGFEIEEQCWHFQS